MLCRPFRGGYRAFPMQTEVTQLLSRIEDGDAAAAEQLLPILYDDLRRVAARKLSDEKPGHTLEATSSVQRPLAEAKELVGAVE